MGITWDAVNKGSGVTLSNGNLTAVAPNSSNTVKATIGKSKNSGKWYWEILVNTSGNAVIGVIGENVSVNEINFRNNDVRYYVGNGQKFPEETAYAEGFRTQTISVLMDLINGELEFWKDGVSQGVSHINLFDLNTIYPAVTTGGSLTSATYVANFGASSFKYEMPRGYQSYDSSQSNIVNKILIQLGSEGAKKISVNDVMSASGSSQLSSSYGVECMIDNRIDTSNKIGSSWRAETNANNIWFQLDFTSYKTIDGIKLLQFAFERDRAFDRIKDCKVTFSDGSSISTTLPDKYVLINQTVIESMWSYISFPPKRTKSVKVEVLSKYQGTFMYREFSLIEVQPFYNGMAIERKYEKIIDMHSEQNFINHGMDTDTEIDLQAEMTNKAFIEQTPTTLGEGKVFSRKIDTSKTPIKGVSIE